MLFILRRAARCLVVVSALLALLFAFTTHAPTTSAEPSDATVRSHEAVQFATVKVDDEGDRELHMDIVLPPAPADTDGVEDGPYPLVVLIHGGAWMSGSRRDMAIFSEYLPTRGYVTASIEYRLLPQAFPAQIHDCKAAVRFLKANADKYKVDADRIAVLGVSAGAHLAMLLGTTDPDDADGELEGDQNLVDGIDSRVQCVISIAGPAGVADPSMMPEGSWQKQVLEALCPDGDFARAAPLTHVTSDDAPTLLIHGTADTTVPPEQSDLMADELASAKVDYKLLKIEGAGHSFGSRYVAQLTEAIDGWLTAYVGDGEGDAGGGFERDGSADGEGEGDSDDDGKPNPNHDENDDAEDFRIDR